MNCVNPGPIESRMMQAINSGQPPDAREAHDKLAAAVPAGRDLLPNLPSFIRRVCSSFALRPNFGSPEAGVFRLFSRRRAGCADVIEQHNRRVLADRPMRAFFVVVLAPIRHLFSGICKAQEPVRVQALRPKAAVEGFQ